MIQPRSRRQSTPLAGRMRLAEEARCFFQRQQIFTKCCSRKLLSTAPVFSTPASGCIGLHLEGDNVVGVAQLQQFAFSPMVAISVTAGASPNAAPVFALPSFTTIENLSVNAYNQAVSLYGTTNA